MNRPVMIGIAGGTGSGKTTVAQSVFDRVGSHRIEWISHDSYYRDFSHLTADERRAVNYDHPDSLETDLMIAQLDELAQGRAVEVPMYDFTRHARMAQATRVEPRRVIIVEGILVLYPPELRERIDIKLFVDTPADIRFIRRMLRDVQSRGRSVESVIDQYLTSVRPMHEEFVEPSKRYADLIIPEGGENRVALDAIISRIEHLLA